MKGWMLGFFLAAILLLFGCQTDHQANEKVEKGDVEVLSAGTGIDKAEAKSIEKNADADTEEALSYSLDKGKEFVYMSELEGGIEVTYSYLDTHRYADDKWDMWLRQAGGEESKFLMKENEDGLFIGYPGSEYYQQLVYPLERGATFNSFEAVYTTAKVEETMTTPAGTFDHVVAVKSPDNYMTFYAPHVGTIKTVDPDGKTTFELIEIID